MKKHISKCIWILTGVLLYSTTFAQSGKVQWYKGNTHTHTTESDGNASPEFVANWYHERGYHFLVITDHNKFVDPEEVKLPENKRDDFILIPGEEVTGKRAIHTTGLNVRGYVNPGEAFQSKTEVLQYHVDGIRKEQGEPILNHPNFVSGAQVSDIAPVKQLYMMELYNGHPAVYNFGRDEGDHIHIPVEAKWDSLLSMGKQLLAVAADDAHHYQTYNRTRSNPGRGWVMVKSKELSADSIVSAMKSGDFYATNGIILSKIDVRRNKLNVEIDVAATQKELASENLTGELTHDEKEGYRIEFVGKDGQVLNVFQGTKGKHSTKNINGYLRARALFVRKLPDGHFEKLYAWTQPVFE